jgi:hypothetical protein
VRVCRLHATMIRSDAALHKELSPPMHDFVSITDTWTSNPGLLKLRLTVRAKNEIWAAKKYLTPCGVCHQHRKSAC